MFFAPRFAMAGSLTLRCPKGPDKQHWDASEGPPSPPAKSNMSERCTSAGHTPGLKAGPGSAHQPTSPGQRNTKALLDEQEVAYLLGATLGVWVADILAPIMVFLMSLMGKPRVCNSALNLTVVNALGYVAILFSLNKFRKDFDEL